MLPAQQLLTAIVASLRDVIAPAIPEPYPRAQAYMAAVILEFVARQVEERRDVAAEKQQALDTLFSDLAALLPGQTLPDSDDPDAEARLSRAIEWLYAERDRLGPETFTAVNQRMRATLRTLLDAELKVAEPPAR